jgi:hypothetical protein
MKKSVGLVLIIAGILVFVACQLMQTRTASQYDGRQVWQAKVDEYIKENKPQCAVNLLLREAQTEINKNKNQGAIEKLRLAKRISRTWEVSMSDTFVKILIFLERKAVNG